MFHLTCTSDRNTCQWNWPLPFITPGMTCGMWGWLTEDQLPFTYVCVTDHDKKTFCFSHSPGHGNTGRVVSHTATHAVLITYPEYTVPVHPWPHLCRSAAAACVTWQQQLRALHNQLCTSILVSLDNSDSTAVITGTVLLSNNHRWLHFTTMSFNFFLLKKKC